MLIEAVRGERDSVRRCGMQIMKGVHRRKTSLRGSGGRGD